MRQTEWCFLPTLICSVQAFSANVAVTSVQELTSAVQAATSGDTVFLEDGTYPVISYGITVRTDRIAIVGKSGDPTKVVVSGAGMNGSIPYGFWIAGDDVTLQNLTVQNVHAHCIQTDVNTDGLRVRNCILRDAHEQLLKIPYDANLKDFSENGLVENCQFYFTKGVGNQYYTGGVDGHYCKNWIVRNNVFRDIRSPDGTIAEHAVHFWSGSEGTLVENNRIINCDRGIGFGLGDRGHVGGIIRNNMIYHGVLTGVDNGDGGILLESSPGTQVYNNSIFFENDYPNAIEYRFAATIGVLIQNNLSNKQIRLRDGATGTVSHNLSNAQKGWFLSATDGDLHLTSQASPARGQGLAMEGLRGDFDGDPRPADAIDLGADQYRDGTVLKAIRMASQPSRRPTRGGACLLPCLTPMAQVAGIFSLSGRQTTTAR
jgi:Right handed beta helix region